MNKKEVDTEESLQSPRINTTYTNIRHMSSSGVLYWYSDYAYCTVHTLYNYEHSTSYSSKS